MEINFEYFLLPLSFHGNTFLRFSFQNTQNNVKRPEKCVCVCVCVGVPLSLKLIHRFGFYDDLLFFLMSVTALAVANFKGSSKIILYKEINVQERLGLNLEKIHRSDHIS